MGDFFGYTTRILSSRFLELEILENAGPRIVRLSYKGSLNLFAELPEISVPTPSGNFHYLGGHRLWHAPESMPKSYIPDDNTLSAWSLTMFRLGGTVIIPMQAREHDLTGLFTTASSWNSERKSPATAPKKPPSAFKNTPQIR